MTFEVQDFIPEHILRMEAYVPGMQPASPDIIKLNTNENPFPPLPAVISAINQAAGKLQLYPEPSSRPLREKLSSLYGQSPESFLIGNGSDEILSLLFRLLLPDGGSCLSSDPAYSLYPVLAAMQNGEILNVAVKSDWYLDLAAMAARAKESSRFIIITHPNAPTGLIEKREDVTRLIQEVPCFVILDEAYMDFAPAGQSFVREAGTDFPNLIVVRTFSKSASLAGMRTGWCVGHPDVIAQLHKIRDSYNVSLIAQAAALAILAEEEANRARINTICQTRDAFARTLQQMGFTVLPSATNFLFVKPPEECTARSLYDSLLSRNILVRHFDRPGLRDYLRISIGSGQAMEKVQKVLGEVLPSA
ncbi:MAG: histidinol-phosphate transaminase [Spirochaetales bacterium]|nr:histidinol-phosphate transaminase [Spirochaetales bacterium]